MKFDLKGSALGRKASKSELMKKSKATLKDLDFERVFPVKSGGLRVRSADYEKLAHRINQDARVLAELEIMDHSLVSTTPSITHLADRDTPTLAWSGVFMWACPKLCPAAQCYPACVQSGCW